MTTRTFPAEAPNLYAELLRDAPRTATLADGRRALDGGELLTEASDAARAIRLAAGPRAVVGVSLPLGVDAVAVLVAAALSDLVVCFLDPSWPEPKTAAVLDAVAPDLLIDASGMRRLGHARDQRAANGVRRAEPGYVAMSSGSLGGPPKGVVSSWDGVGRFVPDGARALDLGPGDMWAEASHLSYDMAMTNLLVALGSGSSVRLSAGLADRLRPLRFLTKVHASHARTAPRFVDLAAAEGVPAPSSLKVWASGGDRLLGSQVELLFRRGVPAVVNTYGTSESTGFASSCQWVPGQVLATEAGCVSIGRGVVGAWRAELVGEPTESGRRQLAVRSSYLPTGYAFGSAGDGYPIWADPHTVVTGDLGVESQGALFCLGRAGRQVKRNGSFVDLDAVDVVVRGLVGAPTFTVLTASGRLSTLVDGTSAVPDDLGSALGSALPAALVPDDVLAVPQIPRLANGKVDHQQAQLLAETATA